MTDLKLVAMDVDGVIREGRKFFYECHVAAMNEVGFGDEFQKQASADDIWHFKGLLKFRDRREALNAMYLLAQKGKMGSIHDLIHLPDAEDRIIALAGSDTSRADEKILDRMVAEYRRVSISPDSKKLITIYPGTEEFLVKMKREGKMLAILTNSVMANVERDIKPLLKYFECVVTAEETGITKPSGKGLVLISKKIGVRLSEMIYVGDTIADIRASRDAGCGCIAIYSGMGVKQHLEIEKPDYLAKDLEEAGRIIMKI